MKHPTTFYWLLFDISLSLRILFFFAFLFHFCTIKFPSRFIGLAQQVQVNRWVTIFSDDLRCKRIIKVVDVDLKFKVAERDEIFLLYSFPPPSSVAAARYPLSHNPSKLRLPLTFFSVTDSHVCFSHILEDSYTQDHLVCMTFYSRLLLPPSSSPSVNKNTMKTEKSWRIFLLLSAFALNRMCIACPCWLGRDISRSISENWLFFLWKMYWVLGKNLYNKFFVGRSCFVHFVILLSVQLLFILSIKHRKLPSVNLISHVVLIWWLF